MSARGGLLRLGLPDAARREPTARYNTHPSTQPSARNQGSGSGANDVTIDESGNVVWTMRSADNVLVATDAPEFEEHVALFEWTWGSAPVKRSSEEYALRIKRVPKVSP